MPTKTRSRNKEFIPQWGYWVIAGFVIAIWTGAAFLFKLSLSPIVLTIVFAVLAWKYRPLLVASRLLFMAVATSALVREIRLSLVSSRSGRRQIDSRAVSRDRKIRPMTDTRSRRRSRVKLACAVLLLLAFWNFCGILVNQPMGAFPDGFTVIYYRQGLNLPFLTSADGLQEQIEGRVSILGRMVVLAGLTDVIRERRIVRLPYSHILYLWTTKGTEYDR